MRMIPKIRENRAETDVEIVAVTEKLDQLNDPNLKDLILKTPVMDTMVTDTSTFDLRIPSFSWPLVSNLLEICTSDDKTVSMIHGPLVILQGRNEVPHLTKGVRKKSPILTTIASQEQVLPETNIAPARKPSQKETILSTIHFQVLCLFQGG